MCIRDSIVNIMEKNSWEDVNWDIYNSTTLKNLDLLLDESKQKINFIFHGLFGRAKNWHSIALKLSAIVDGLFIVFDLRNHGENE